MLLYFFHSHNLAFHRGLATSGMPPTRLRHNKVTLSKDTPEDPQIQSLGQPRAAEARGGPLRSVSSTPSPGRGGQAPPGPALLSLFWPVHQVGVGVGSNDGVYGTASQRVRSVLMYLASSRGRPSGWLPFPGRAGSL